MVIAKGRVKSIASPIRPLFPIPKNQIKYKIKHQFPLILPLNQ